MGAVRVTPSGQLAWLLVPVNTSAFEYKFLFGYSVLGMRTPKASSSLDTIPEVATIVERLEESVENISPISPISQSTPIREGASQSSPSSSIRPDDEVIPSQPVEDWTGELEINPQDPSSPSPSSLLNKKAVKEEEEEEEEEVVVVSGVARRRALLRRRTREAAARDGNLGGKVLPTPVLAVVKIQSAWRSKYYYI